MFDDDVGWPQTLAAWASGPLRALAPPTDDLSTAAPVFVTVDFDTGRSPHHWPYWPEPWRRGFQAFPDDGLTLGISGIGTVGAATFVLELEPGTKVTYAWSTSIITTYSGKEQRQSPFGQPRRHFEGNAFLLDAGVRDASGTLMRAAASGSTFLLALPFEELTIVADSPGNVVTVATTALSDWALPGQRCVIVASDGTSVAVVVQAITATTIQVRVTDATGAITTATLGSAGAAGGRIMPVLPVLLEAQQGFARYPTAADLWAIRAQANVFGWASVDAMGIGVALTTFTDGVSQQGDITDADLLIWDRPNLLDGTATEAMLSGAEIVDLGALPFAAGAHSVPDWGRSIKYRSTSSSEWQWFKAFIRHLRGRQGTFALPTGRPDLIWTATVSGGIKVQSASVAGGGDYVSWFASAAHRRLAITIGGVVQLFEVLSVTDNHDGTLTLSLDSNVAGTPSKVSFLEQVRFDRDEIQATWDGGVFTIDEIARVVQDALEVPSRHFFDKVVSQDFRYTGIPPDVPPTDQEFVVTLGTNTLINWTSDRSLTFGGVSAQNGSGPIDGQILCISVVNNTSSGLSITHEDTNWPPSDRFHNVALGTVGGVNKTTWHRYNGAIGRWIQIV